MKLPNSLLLLLISITLTTCSSKKEAPNAPEENLSPVATHGQLSIEDGKIKNASGEPVQLKGMSLFWSQWLPQYYNQESVKNLVTGWDIQLIRAAMAVEHDGYLENPEREKMKVEKVIEAAIDLGIYVIVDWHDHHAEDHLPQAKKFFSEIAREYGDYPNLIYEVYNEPLDVSWSQVLKPYHEEVVAAIREHDPDNIIVLGTPTWSQRVDLAAKDPLEGENLAYTLHFYAGTHRQELREIAETAMNKGLAIFVTEFGTTDANGDGPVYGQETGEWMEFMKRHNLSWANWSVADKDESSAALLPGTTPSEINREENISTSGKLVRSYLSTSN
ncbi:glycoside hydrolase family 5 protein [Salinimicrobium sp. WS361]|uniref:glycoside hydrolase family 5 protein n=1 Tax=Salinimicrobium sp. WS361 TaxID=3425123 RepID=UPI003D6ECF25